MTKILDEVERKTPASQSALSPKAFEAHRVELKGRADETHLFLQLVSVFLQLEKIGFRVAAEQLYALAAVGLDQALLDEAMDAATARSDAPKASSKLAAAFVGAQNSADVKALERALAGARNASEIAQTLLTVGGGKDHVTRLACVIAAERGFGFARLATEVDPGLRRKIVVELAAHYEAEDRHAVLDVLLAADQRDGEAVTLLLLAELRAPSRKALVAHALERMTKDELRVLCADEPAIVQLLG